MTPPQELPLAIHPLGPTPGIQPFRFAREVRTERCEIRIHIGLFFDGAGNNKDWDDHDDCQGDEQGPQLAQRKESNVARLLDEPENITESFV